MATKATKTQTTATARRSAVRLKNEQREEEARKKHEEAVAYHKAATAAQQERSRAIALSVESVRDDDPVLLERVAILRRQIPETGPVLPSQCMVVQGIEGGKGRCISCGDALAVPAVWRCPTCIKAYRLVDAEHLEAAVRRDRTVDVGDDFSLDDDF